MWSIGLRADRFVWAPKSQPGTPELSHSLFWIRNAILVVFSQSSPEYWFQGLLSQVHDRRTCISKIKGWPIWIYIFHKNVGDPSHTWGNCSSLNFFSRLWLVMFRRWTLFSVGWTGCSSQDLFLKIAKSLLLKNFQRNEVRSREQLCKNSVQRVQVWQNYNQRQMVNYNTICQKIQKLQFVHLQLNAECVKYMCAVW